MSPSHTVGLEPPPEGRCGLLSGVAIPRSGLRTCPEVDPCLGAAFRVAIPHSGLRTKFWVYEGSKKFAVPSHTVGSKHPEMVRITYKLVKSPSHTVGSEPENPNLNPLKIETAHRKGTLTHISCQFDKGSSGTLKNLVFIINQF